MVVLKRVWMGVVVAVIVLACGSAAADGVVAWAGKDTKGGEVEVPGEGKMSVVVFLRAGQGQSEEAIKVLAGVLKSRRDVQVVGVVSGDAAEVGAVQLAKEWSWPLVADPEYAASGAFGVKVWPTTVVVGKQGELVAHEAGLGVTYGNDVGAYVDFAAGKIDRAGLDKALANREVVADSTAQKAARHVEVALRLAGKGMTEDAKTELAKAVELKPTEGRVLLTMARVELMVGDAKGAEGFLGQMKAGDAGAAMGEVNVIKGWAAVVEGRWADAKSVLTTAAKLNPDPAEAFYLLGRVYEHEGDAGEAAEFYRKAFEWTEVGRGMGK